MTDYRIFNRRDVVATGWYWLLPGKDLKRGSVRAANILGYELAVYRGQDGSVTALDAYCPHMGAHLSEGRVEGNQLRCFFHNWCFDSSGKCTDIPCLEGKPRPNVRTKTWQVQERHGLIWVWLGPGPADEPVPEPLALTGEKYVACLGNHFVKHCHPNVVMVNAIDEQHFQTVHRLPGHILSMDPGVKSRQHIEFRNAGKVPRDNLIGKLLGPLYKGSLTYNLDYWYGSTGTVTLGPDCLQLYLMFTLRLAPDGKTEGYAVTFAKLRKGLFSGVFNRIIHFATKLAAMYFAQGDTRIFQTIRFRFNTPIAADRAVIAFIDHLDKQTPFPAFCDQTTKISAEQNAMAICEN